MAALGVAPIPLSIVLLVPLVVVLGELMKTFGRETAAACSSRWSWALIGVNVVVAGVTFVLVVTGLHMKPSVALAVTVGLTYPVLIRSRLTLLRQIGPSDSPDLSAWCLKVDEWYTSLQSKCYWGIDDDVAPLRCAKVRRLEKKYDTDELKEMLKNLRFGSRIPGKQAQIDEVLRDVDGMRNEGQRRSTLAQALVELDVRHPSRLLGQN